MPDTLQSVFDLPEVSFIDNDTVDAMMNRTVSYTHLTLPTNREV